MKLDLSDRIVTVVGDVMLDVYFMGQVKRLSPEAPVPIVQVKEKTATLGGAGNVALNLAGLGCRAHLMGVRGDDIAGKRLSDLLSQHQIMDRLLVDPKHPTTTKTRIIGQGQQLLRLDEEKTWQSTKALQRRLLSQFKNQLKTIHTVILSDYNKGALTPDTVREMIACCRDAHIPIFVDPKGADWTHYDHATCITPNTAEVELTAGMGVDLSEKALQDAAISLRQKHHLGHLLVTRGAKGMFLLGDEDRLVHIPAAVREVFDVSGAGDTVIATLAAAVAAGIPFTQAAALANLAAGIVVGKLGSQAISITELQAACSKSGASAGGFNKIATLAAARIQVKAWQALGEKVVFTNGCFDLLHPGHIHILHQAQQMGNRLVVGVNTDASIRKIKGAGRPIVTQQDRADVLSALSCVDLILFFKEKTPLNLIKTLKPDILVKGADYRLDQVVGADIVASYGGEVRLVSLLKGHSTTGLVNKLKPTK